MQRKDVTFVCGTDTCAAWLYAPADGGSDGTVPLIVMAHVQAAIAAAAAAGGHLPAVGQPHEAAFINAPGAEAGWRHVVSIGEDSRWRNRASAGWLLSD